MVDPLVRLFTSLPVILCVQRCTTSYHVYTSYIDGDFSSCSLTLSAFRVLSSHRHWRTSSSFVIQMLPPLVSVAVFRDNKSPCVRPRSGRTTRSVICCSPSLLLTPECFAVAASRYLSSLCCSFFCWSRDPNWRRKFVDRHPVNSVRGFRSGTSLQ